MATSHPSPVISRLFSIKSQETQICWCIFLKFTMIITACQLKIMCFAQVPKQAQRPILLGLTQDKEKQSLNFPTSQPPLKGQGFFIFSPKNCLQWQKTRPANTRGECESNTQVGLIEVRTYDLGCQSTQSSGSLIIQDHEHTSFLPRRVSLLQC